MTRIGVISDTHGFTHRTSRAVEMFHDRGVSQIIHCGDICLPSDVDLFIGISTVFIFGNCEGFRREAIRRRIEELKQTLLEPAAPFEMEGKRIAAFHGDDEIALEQAIHGQKWDMICHGHTHLFRNEYKGKTLVVNPGAMDGRWEPPSVALVEIPAMKVTKLLVL